MCSLGQETLKEGKLVPPEPGSSHFAVEPGDPGEALGRNGWFTVKRFGVWPSFGRPERVALDVCSKAGIPVTVYLAPADAKLVAEALKAVAERMEAEARCHEGR